MSRAASLSGDMLVSLPSNRSVASDLQPGQSGEQATELQTALSGPLPPLSSVSSAAPEIEPMAEAPGAKVPPRRTRLQAMQERIDLLEKELLESEHTHKLRYVQCSSPRIFGACRFPLFMAQPSKPS